MAIGAIVSGFTFQPNIDGSIQLQAEVLLAGVSGTCSVVVNILATDSLAQIQTKITDGVVACATGQGVSVVRNQVLMPSFTRGN